VAHQTEQVTMQHERPLVHGALDFAELAHLGFSPEEVCDFSVNINPYGPSPLVAQALARIPVERYPDRECLQLRQTLLQHEIQEQHITEEMLLCGNGTAELIWAIARAYLSPQQKTAVLEPTFGEYRYAAQATGAQVIGLRATLANVFAFDVDNVMRWLLDERPALLWLCNPNNPTGSWLPLPDLHHLLDACQESGTLLVVDEAYWHFLTPLRAFPSAITLLRDNAPLLVLRSLTKAYALAGVRLGYLVAAPEHIAHVRRQLPSWNVNSFAQAAGCAAVADQAHLEHTLHALKEERLAFYQALQASGIPALPSQTHFFLLHVEDATTVRSQLLQRRLLVRDCTSFGLPEIIRVATRPRRDWLRLLQALQELL
jgi:histidinol-phosphate aminotransferase